VRTRFGAELPGPGPPQENVDDLRGELLLLGSGSGKLRPAIGLWPSRAVSLAALGVVTLPRCFVIFEVGGFVEGGLETVEDET
jgi:hypothetical protein